MSRIPNQLLAFPDDIIPIEDVVGAPHRRYLRVTPPTFRRGAHALAHLGPRRKVCVCGGGGGTPPLPLHPPPPLSSGIRTKGIGHHPPVPSQIRANFTRSVLPLPVIKCVKAVAAWLPSPPLFPK